MSLIRAGENDNVYTVKAVTKYNITPGFPCYTILPGCLQSTLVLKVSLNISSLIKVITQSDAVNEYRYVNVKHQKHF